MHGGSTIRNQACKKPQWEPPAPGVEIALVDKAYKADIRRLKNTFIKLKEEFSSLDSGTDWTRLRIEPLLRHAEALEHLLNSPDFSNEFSRLRKGVVMFHSDLVYLRENVKALEKMLESEKRRK